MTDFSLSSSERVTLKDLLAHTRDARLTLRIYALLWLDAGDSLAEVAARLSVTRQTVHNWVSRFQLRSTPEFITRLADGPRGGRPRTATAATVEALIASVIERDPRELEYRATVWTAPLLAQYVCDEQQLLVSDDSVRRIIARLRLRWKRPRHNLALRSETWRQAKGG